jgi:hypothetical protein
MSESSGISWTGLALIALGLFLVLRTVRADSRGKTLVNRILGT